MLLWTFSTSFFVFFPFFSSIGDSNNLKVRISLVSFFRYHSYPANEVFCLFMLIERSNSARNAMKINSISIINHKILRLTLNDQISFRANFFAIDFSTIFWSWLWMFHRDSQFFCSCIYLRIILTLTRESRRTRGREQTRQKLKSISESQ